MWVGALPPTAVFTEVSCDGPPFLCFVLSLFIVCFVLILFIAFCTQLCLAGSFVLLAIGSGLVLGRAFALLGSCWLLLCFAVTFSRCTAVCAEFCLLETLPNKPTNKQTNKRVTSVLCVRILDIRVETLTGKGTFVGR